VTAPVVIFAVGNPSRGDDAIGPECCARLEQWLANEGLAERFELIEDFQLQIEHALDLQGRQLALFIDAGARTPGPFTFRRIAPATGAATLPPLRSGEFRGLAQARRHIAEAGNFHLGTRGAGAGIVVKNFEDDHGAVHHLAADFLFKVACLRR